MFANPTITAEDFSTIHNGLCDLRQVCDRLDGVLSPELYQLLLRARDQIRSGLDSAYEQDDRAFAKKSRHYDEVSKELGIRDSEWSIHTVEDMNDRHPFEGADCVVYRNHWGPKSVSANVNGLTWAALWVAANQCIRDSGDSHHVYIENFEQDSEDPRTVFLSTGS